MSANDHIRMALVMAIFASVGAALTVLYATRYQWAQRDTWLVAALFVALTMFSALLSIHHAIWALKP